MQDKPWLRHYDHWVPEHINYPHMPLSRLLVIASIVYPRHTATLFYGAEMTYLELREHVTRLAAALEDLGLGKGDRIGVMLPNSPQYIIAFYATQWIGATVVNMSTLWVEREIAEAIEDTEMAALVTEDTLAAKVPDTDMHLITAARAAYMPEDARPDTDPPPLPEGAHRWADLIQTPPRPFDVDIDPEEDVAVLQYTGGTTGTPKPAMLTHYGLTANVVQAGRWAGLYANDGNETFLCVIPFSHGYGMNLVMNRAIFHGYRMALVPEFDIHMLIDIIQTYRPTHFYTVPALLRAIMGRRQIDQAAIKALKFVGCGSSPLPRDLMIRYETQMDGMFTEGYGLTEACLLVTLWPIFNQPNRASVGVPMPDVTVRIMDAEAGERVLPPGEVGEIVVNAPQVMKGYWRRPEETAQVLRQDDAGRRWLHTGDLGYMDEAGCLYVVGRKKDMIIVAGYNVYPTEVEAVLEQYPGVAEAAVVGIPDRTRGERIYAYVVPDGSAALEEGDILDYCKANLAAFKVPRRVVFREGLPKGGIGKVLRGELVRQEMEPAHRDGARPDYQPPVVSANVTPAIYFTGLLPRDFAAYADAHPPDEAMAGKDFTVQYTIDAEVYTVRVLDGMRMEVEPAPTDAPTIAVTTDLASWRDSVTGTIFTGLSPVAQGVTRRRLAQIEDVRGTAHLELTRPDDSLYRASIIYHGGAETVVTVQMRAEDYSAMSRGKLGGVEALMSGKLRAHGDMGFLRTLAKLRE